MKSGVWSVIGFNKAFKFFLTNYPEKGNFNFLKQAQLYLTTQRNVKLTKFLWLASKIWKLDKRLSTQSFKQTIKFKWLWARNGYFVFFHNAKSFLRLLFGCILEEKLINIIKTNKVNINLT